MSMEVTKRDAWRNIMKLIQLRWKNGKFVLWLLLLLVFCLAVGLLSLRSLWMSGGYSVDDWVIFLNYGGFGNFALIIFMAGLMFCTGSVLNEESVGMYPGTVKTRYISRILSDWLLLIVFVAEMSLLNLLQTVVYVWMSKKTGNFAGVRIPETLGWGILLTLLCILAIYSVTLFLQTLHKRIGSERFWIGIGIVIVYVVLELKTPLRILETFLGSIHYFIFGQEGEIPVRIALVSGVVLLIFMVLNVCLLQGIHSWKEDSSYAGKVVLRFLILFGCYLAMGVSVMDYGYRWGDGAGTLEEQIENGSYLVKDTVQSCMIDQSISEKLDQSMDDLNINFSIQWISLEQAKKVGIVAEDFSLGDHEICIRTLVNNCEVQGTSLTKGFLDAALTIEGGNYQIKQPLKIVLNNNYVSLFTSLFLSNKEKESLEMLRNESLGDFLGYFIIYNQEDIAKDQIPMSMSAGMALSVFDNWELEE